VQAVKVAPVVQPKVIDELEPLPKLTPRPAKALVAPRPAREAVVEQQAQVEAQPEPTPVAAEPAKAADFSFLESAEAPKSELKRPTSEL
jgi:cell division septation protein DedD